MSAFQTPVARTISLSAATLANANVLTVTGANNTIAAGGFRRLATVSALPEPIGAPSPKPLHVDGQESAVHGCRNLTSSRQHDSGLRTFAAETAKLDPVQRVATGRVFRFLAQANQTGRS